MSSEKAIVAIETVRKKLEKYVQTKQEEKVKEYLNKLQNTSVTPSLLRETKIDSYVSQLASESHASYSSVARTLLRKWNEKNQPAKSTATNNSASKVKTITNTNQKKNDERTSVKRKSDHDDSNRQSGSQSTSETNKKRKVLSFEEYFSHKKPVSSTANSTDNKLTDTDVEQIYAQFSANIQPLVANASDLATNVNKKLKQKDQLPTSRPASTADSSVKPKEKEFWDLDDDDDDDERSVTPPAPAPKQQPVKKSTPLPKPVAQPAKVKTEANSSKPSVSSAPVAAKPAHFPPPPPPPPPPAPQPSSSNASDYLQSKQVRQKIYSGKRTVRTSIPSLQDLCVEKLKENIEDTCQKHLNLLPYDVVKPIIDVASPDQLDRLISNNPDYADEVEPLWKHFCLINYKDATRDECETFYELYLRKRDEQEEKFLQFTELAKRKKATTVDHARQTKTICFPSAKVPNAKNHLTSQRILVNLPSSTKFRGAAAAKAKSKPTMTPLFKKAMKLYNGKSH